MIKMLETIFPQYDWNSVLTTKSKSKYQSCVEETLSQLLPGFGSFMYLVTLQAIEF